jgi:hypothetical protein
MKTDTKTTQHTPTPWKTNGRYILDGDSFSKPSIAMVTQLKGKNNNEDVAFQELAEANAAFIVRAVNCHGELVEAIQWALSGEYVTQDGQRIPMVAGETRAMLERALTKAVEK